MVNQIDERHPRLKLKRVVRNLHWAWIIPFGMIENLPTLFAGLFDVVVDTVTIGRQYLVAVRHSVENMNEFHAVYHRDSDNEDLDDDFSETESVSDNSLKSSAGSRVSTRSSTKKNA